MKLLNNKKGQMRVIEAFFAALLVLSCLSFVPAQQPQVDRSEDLSAKAQNILVSLDNNGYLSQLIEDQDWDSIRSCIQSTLPLMVWFNLTIYDTNLNVLNEYPISNGGAVSDKISSTEYVCATQNQEFTVYILQLQLAGAD